jgi:tRNA A-37 threonylcarbamoyl transferase component Bud32
VCKTLLRPHKTIVDEDLPGRLMKTLSLPALKSPTLEREQGRLIGRLHKKKRVVENIISTLNPLAQEFSFKF